MGKGGWGTQGGIGYLTEPPPAPGLTALGISDAAIHAFTSLFQGVAETGVGEALASS